MSYASPITVMQVCCKEDSYCERWTFRLDVDKEYHYGSVFSRQVDLAHNKILKKLSSYIKVTNADILTNSNCGYYWYFIINIYNY